MTENIKTENNMSSSGLTRRSRNKDFMCLLDARSGSGMTSTRGESGRSMVEMLGTLAIIGVLSVGGIAGYTYAMNKYYANELLAGASERAVLVTAQIASGRKPSLKEFANHTTAGGTFATDDESIRVYTDGIGIPVSGVKGAVCENLLKATEGTDILITDIDENEISADDCAEESNDLLFVFETGIGGGSGPTAGNAGATEDEDGAVCSGHGYKDSNDDCVCDPGYNGTDCATAACTTGTYCGSGATKECCATDEVCTTSGDVAGTCVKNSSGCTTNASCIGQTVGATTCTSENCYCKLENTNYGCRTPDKGTCTTLDAGRETTYTDLTDSTKTKTFLVSSDAMSWWAADNWCKAHDMKLVSYNTAHSLFDCDKSNSCTWSKFTTSENWSNGTLPDHYWTAESYKSTNAWGVFVCYDYFSYSCRFNTYYALCE